MQSGVDMQSLLEAAAAVGIYAETFETIFMDLLKCRWVCLRLDLTEDLFFGVFFGMAAACLASPLIEYYQ